MDVGDGVFDYFADCLGLFSFEISGLLLKKCNILRTVIHAFGFAPAFT